MRTSLCLVTALIVAAAHTGFAVDPPERLPRFDDIPGWRAMGPRGLAILIEQREQVRQSSRGGQEARMEWLDEVIDAVAQQRDARWSGLFWYTDLEAAKDAAKREGKPILSLRLLGKLTDEYSCANSRYFRSLLYANKQVSDYLRENFVLHWQTHRPVPIATIDFGDGRVMKRTLTGNSIHYILDAQGHIIDTLPGLYDPRTFLATLREVRTAMSLMAYIATWKPETSQVPDVITCSSAFTSGDGGALQRHHKAVRGSLYEAWARDLGAIGRPVTVEKEDPPVPARPTAAEAAVRAETKRRVEVRLVTHLSPATAPRLAEQLDHEAWVAMSALHLDNVRFDDASTALMRRQNPELDQPQFQAMVEKLRRSVALDTVRNQYLMRARIAGWLAEFPILAAFPDSLNERVYGELFLTPSADPWLGLYEPTDYTGLSSTDTMTAVRGGFPRPTHATNPGH